VGASGETATGHLVCEDKAEAGVVPLAVVALDFASTVDKVAGLIEEECQLDQAVEIAIGVGAPQEGNLWRRESDFGGAH